MAQMNLCRDFRVHVEVRYDYGRTPMDKDTVLSVSEGSETERFEGANGKSFKCHSKAPSHVGDLCLDSWQQPSPNTTHWHTLKL